VSDSIYGIAVYASVTTLKARMGPRLEKHVYVRENRKLYRWIPGNADADDSEDDANTIAPTGGYAGRWKTIGVIPGEAEDVGELTDSTSGTAGDTIANVGASFSQATLNNNFASMLTKVNDIRAVLRAAGLMA
jgi:hypothetical protein